MKRIDSSEVILILANCVPMAGVLFFDWSLFSLLISYWLETGVIGIFIVLKSLSIYFWRIPSKTIFLINGFALLITIGGFMFGHFIGIMALFSVIPGGDGWTGLDLLSQSSTQVLTILATLLISHGYSFFYNFIGRDEKASIIRLVKQVGVNSPKVGGVIMGDFFIRIFLTQFVIILGGVILALTKTAIYLSVIFIIIKTAIDLVLHRKRHTLNTASL